LKKRIKKLSSIRLFAKVHKSFLLLFLKKKAFLTALMEDGNLLASFMAYLEPHRIDGAPQALLSLCGTRDVDGWRRRHALRPTAERIGIQVADADQALWQGCHCGVRVLFGGPMRIELVLPPEFRSKQAMRAFLERRGVTFLHIILRLRDILLSVCDMLLADRVAFTLAVRDRLGHLPASIWFRISPEDGCEEPGVFTTSRPAGATNIVIPDCYYYESDGYVSHQEAVARASLPWARRNNLAFWRGTTTGAAFSAEDLDRNERIRLAAACASRPDLFDVKLSNIAQVPEASIPLVRARLEERGLFAAPVPMEVFSRYKFALQVDGNASAWSFFEKFALACCVLRVASRFEAWFEPRIAPWEHFVPIAEDLHDLIATTEMLTRTPVLAERIARAGFAFAVEANFSHEARLFCRSLVAALGDPETIRVTHLPVTTSD